MLKWLALILVTAVLCWGDTGSHSSSRHSEDSPKTNRPVVEESLEAKDLDGLNENDKKQLDALIQELEGVGKVSNRKVGEQDSVEITTIPNP